MTESVPPSLHLLSEDWQRALVIVAHPDDIEYGAAAAIARWTGEGKDIRYCLVTSGEAGIDTMAPEQARRLRRAEQRASARLVGVSEVEFLEHVDGAIEYGIGLRRDLARAIRRHQPEIVITGNFRETWDGGMLNQADHIATGRAALDAIRDAANRWIFPDLSDANGEILEPSRTVRELWAAGSPLAKHAVDTTDTFEVGVASLRAHGAYLEGLTGVMSEPEDFLDGLGRGVGTRLGTRHAALFEVFSLA